MSDISKSILEDNAEFNEKAKDMSPEQIKELARELLTRPNAGFARDIFSPDVLVPTQAEPQNYAITVTIRGRKHIVEGRTPEELRENQIALMERELNGESQQSTEQPRNERGQFVSADAQAEPDAAEQQAQADADAAQAANDAELRLKMMRGEISATQYLEQSGALDDWYAKKVQQEAEVRNEINGWNAAVSRWLEGSDWPGGSENEATMKDILQQNPELLDYPDKTKALDEVYLYMRENDLLKTNPAAEAAKKLALAATPEEIHDALNFYRPGGSGVWNR
jgi:hypothetical protein